VNRRISIVVMTQKAEEDAQRIDIPAAPAADADAEAAVMEESPVAETTAPAEAPAAEAPSG
jgi:hypothetical protein